MNSVQAIAAGVREATQRGQITPEARGLAMAATLEQLGGPELEAHIIGLRCADLGAAYRALSEGAEGEHPAIAARRRTCGEIAALCPGDGQITPGVLNLWRAWRDHFASSTDPRHHAMAVTFGRELSELEAHVSRLPESAR